MCAASSESADFRIKIAPNQMQRFVWSTMSSSQSSGQEKGKPFTLSSESTSGMTLILRGLPSKPDHLPVMIRFQDFSWGEKRSIDEAKAEAYVSKNRIKCTENGKVTVDSENDVGLERVKEYQQHIKRMEESEMRAVLDSAGRQSDMQGDPQLVEMMKAGGAHGLFPILAGKELKLGETWEDTFSIPLMGEFKLARPVTVRSKMTFVKWEVVDGKEMARIDSTSSWDNDDLKGESPAGMIAEITGVNSRGTGTSLFDPVAGRYIEGTIEYNIKYKINGELNGQTTSLNVTGKSLFNFKTLDK